MSKFPKAKSALGFQRTQGFQAQNIKAAPALRTHTTCWPAQPSFYLPRWVQGSPTNFERPVEASDRYGFAADVLAKVSPLRGCMFHRAVPNELQAVVFAWASEERYLGNRLKSNLMKLVQLWDDVCFDHGPLPTHWNQLALLRRRALLSPRKTSECFYGPHPSSSP